MNQVEYLTEEETALRFAGVTRFLGGFWITESRVSGTEEAEKFSASDAGLAGVS